MTLRPITVRPLLERFYRSFDVARHIDRDPIRYPHRYEDRDDVEAAGFIAASLAFGRVAAFAAVLDGLFAALGPHPARVLQAASSGDAAARAQVAAASTRRYRWLEPPELEALLLTVGQAQREHGSLEALFATCDAETKPEPEDSWQALAAFLRLLREMARQWHPTPDERSRAINFLFPDAGGAAACKRQHLFLRWMVRSTADGADFGLWTALSPARLVMPADVHTARIGHALGLTSSGKPSHRTADELTHNLRLIDQDDPVRFDFALSHLGISGGCQARQIVSVCGACDLRQACRWWGKA